MSRQPVAPDPDIEAALAELAQEGDSVPRPALALWTDGDRCMARGLPGRVLCLGPDCAVVTADSGRELYVGLDELTPI